MLIEKHIVYLGLGSNQGDKEQNLRKAIQLIGDRVGEVTRQSSFIETEPWGYDSQNTYLNAVIRCETKKGPRQVLELTQQIERLLGRTTKSVNRQYLDRPIDIDILLYDDLTVDEPDLKIPHPLMHQRDFVMQPLLEIKEQR